MVTLATEKINWSGELHFYSSDISNDCAQWIYKGFPLVLNLFDFFTAEMTTLLKFRSVTDGIMMFSILQKKGLNFTKMKY